MKNWQLHTNTSRSVGKHHVLAVELVASPPLARLLSTPLAALTIEVTGLTSWLLSTRRRAWSLLSLASHQYVVTMHLSRCPDNPSLSHYQLYRLPTSTPAVCCSIAASEQIGPPSRYLLVFCCGGGKICYTAFKWSQVKFNDQLCGQSGRIAI